MTCSTLVELSDGSLQEMQRTMPPDPVAVKWAAKERSGFADQSSADFWQFLLMARRW